MATLSWPVVRPIAEKFEGVGMQFGGKLIGIMDVPELKGDKICFEAMQALKAEMRRRGEHKPRISVGVSYDGIAIHGQPTGILLHQHAVRCISFIWRDPTDSRAFGYITALTADTKKQFFAIKTEKTSDQVIMALKEMFQVILERRKETDEKKEKEEKEKEQEKEKEKLEAKKEEPKTPTAEPPKEEKKVEENNLLDLIDPNAFYETAPGPAAAAPVVPKEDPNRNPLEDVFGSFGAPAPAAAAPAALPSAAASIYANNAAASIYANNDLFGGPPQPAQVTNPFGGGAAAMQQQQPPQSAYQNLASLVSSTPYGAIPPQNPYGPQMTSPLFGMQQPYGMQQPFGAPSAAAVANPFGARPMSYPGGPTMGVGAPPFGAPNPFGGSQMFGAAPAADLLQPSRPGVANPFGSATSAPLPAAPVEPVSNRPLDPFAMLVDSMVDQKDQFGAANKMPGPSKTMNEIAFDRLTGPAQPNLFDAPAPGSSLLQPQQPLLFAQPAAAPAKPSNDFDLLFS